MARALLDMVLDMKFKLKIQVSDMIELGPGKPTR
uniref:Uncharacterized protein n=1 Tax=Nelumbo nucifera TaxID=4432 RepID=A0A822ZJ69_NELNU|nr:TPA_asm: hypothetical protein HUJ06_001725 [Nelumbo nucifera]